MVPVRANVLALTEGPNHVCYRYRIRAFEPFLEEKGCRVTVWPLAKGLPERLKQLRGAREFDAVILQRRLLSTWETAWLRRHARRLVFDYDDAVMYRDSYHPKGLDAPRRRRRFRSIAGSADVLIAGNAFLADRPRALGVTPRSVVVVPTCVDPDRYPIKEPREGPVRLVWIGSSSTLQSLESQRARWDEVGRRFPDLTLRIIADRFPDLGALRVEPIRWEEKDEAQAISACDIGINFAPDDDWSRGKCGLKILQYQACALPVITDRVGVHPSMVRDGETGFLAESTGDVIDAIDRLATDPSLRGRMGRTGREQIEREYAPSRWADNVFAALSDRSIP
ncbi:MAG: glycosyltransferase family 4 protein [Isosphaeraceae bacterium]